MKRMILLSAVLALSMQAFSQCTPDNTLQVVGLYPPDSMLPCVETGVYFDEVIQFKNFSAIDGTSFGFPGIFTVISVTITNVSNLPAGLSYTCNDPNCEYTTAEVGCVNVTGTTTAPPGDYHLGFFATVQLSLNGGPPFPINADSALLASNGLAYRLVVIGQGDTCTNATYVPPVCFPDPTLTQVGFYPADSLLDCVVSGTYYDVVIQFKNFDTVQGAAIGFPGFVLPIVSVELTNVTNKPAGLGYECNNPDCIFLGNETGCVRISGYTNAAPGVYNMGFFATVKVNINGTITTLQADSMLLANAGLGYSLTVIPAGTTCPNTFVAGPLVANASSPPVACEGDTIPLSVSINGGVAPYTFAWSPGGNLSNPAAPNPGLFPNNPGTYSVTVTDNSGTTMSDDVTIQYTPVPAITVSDDTTICLGGSAQLSASGGSSYQWTPLTGLNASLIPDPISSPASSITYTVHISDGTCTNSGSVSVTVDTSSPTADFTFIKNNFTVAFVKDPSNPSGVTYEWDFGDGSTSAQASPVHQYLQQQIFTVQLIATNPCGLKDTFTTTVDMSVGIGALAGADGLQVYPNPGNGVYNVKIKNADAAGMDVEVVTLHGESVFRKHLPAQPEVFSLDLSNQPKGIYFLKITRQDGSAVKKVVIQ